MPKTKPKNTNLENASVSRADHWVKGGDIVNFEPSLEHGILSAPADELQRVWLESITTGAEKAKNIAQFANKILGKLAGWVDNNVDYVSKGVITTRDQELLFIAVQRQTEFNPELEDSLLDLEFEISDDKELKAFSLSTIILIEKSSQTLQNFLSDFNFVYVGSKKK
jgi:hypothetical protein